MYIGWGRNIHTTSEITSKFPISVADHYDYRRIVGGFIRVPLLLLYVNHSTTGTTSTAALLDDNDAVSAVVQAVADAENTSPLELSPLANVIDPDALESLVDSLATSSGQSDASVSFGYSGYLVTVDGHCDVALSEAETDY